jgi:hypothetical protein
MPSSPAVTHTGKDAEETNAAGAVAATASNVAGDASSVDTGDAAAGVASAVKGAPLTTGSDVDVGTAFNGPNQAESGSTHTCVVPVATRTDVANGAMGTCSGGGLSADMGSRRWSHTSPFPWTITTAQWPTWSLLGHRNPVIAIGKVAVPGPTACPSGHPPGPEPRRLLASTSAKDDDSELLVVVFVDGAEDIQSSGRMDHWPRKASRT